ncbi:SDR family oxidoreductase [Roseibium sp. SCP14]|uniref:SDR family oxidoreductase n=1 Tax=Roseibium sp. SCP14 TaxID=3141375 RepID=UPI003336CB82
MSIKTSKKVLVTGATSGIGRAVCRKMSSDGHKVLALGRNETALSELQASGNVTPLALDVTDRDGLESALQGEAIDVLVNNAGIMPPVVAFQDMDQVDIDATLEVNLSAAIALTRLVLPGMVGRGSGHLFFTSSTSAHAAFPNMAVYGASKAALSAFAASLRCDLAGTGIRVTEIVAGRVETDLYRGVLDAAARRKMYSTSRAVQPQDAADMLSAVLQMPEHVDVTRFDILPTDQYVGGGAMVERKAR